MIDPTNSPEFRFAATIQRRVNDIVYGTSVPIFGANPASLRQDRGLYIVEGPPITKYASGTLFAVGSQHFLITAGHVVNEIRESGCELRIGMGNPSRPQPIGANDDAMAVDAINDVAVIRLPSDLIPRLYGSRFLQLENIALNADLEDWRCVLFGYLATGTQPNKDYSELLLHNFMHWTTKYEGHVNADSYDRSRHLLVEYHPMGWSIRDGIPCDSPKSLQGLSGSSLWRIFKPKHIEDGWTTDTAKVVAVENVVYDDRIVRCTRWELVLPLLARFEPSIDVLRRELVDQGRLDDLCGH